MSIPLRDKILTTSKSLFARNGFEKTSLQQLLADVGCSKGALYHHFDSKEAILLELQLQEIDAAIERGRAIVAGDGPALDRIVAFAVQAAQRMSTGREFTSVYLDQPVALSEQHREVVFDRRRRYERLLADLVREAIDDGGLPEGVDAALAAKAILAMANSVHRWFRSDGPLDPTQIGEAFAAIIIDGLLIDVSAAL